MPLRRASLTVYPLPLLPQSSFDRLLWACDMNFVRGEDSFVRAMGRAALRVADLSTDRRGHLVKLEAFCSDIWIASRSRRSCGGAGRPGTARGGIAAAWPESIAQRKAIERQGKAWANRLDQTGDLAENLVSFVRGIQPHLES